MYLRSLPLVLILALTFFIGDAAQAISVGPAIIEASVDAGKQTDFSVLVTNEEQETLTYSLSIQKFIPQGDSGALMFLPQEDTSGLPDWLFLDAPSITLRAGESKKLSASLRVPTGATTGGHYAAIFLTQTNLDTAVGQNVSAIPRIGVLVFATVNGNVVERLALQDTRVELVSGSHLPARFVVEVENQGNVHVLPDVQIQIKNVLGQTVALIDGNAVDGRVLPGSKRIFVSEWSKNTADNGSGFWHELQQEWRNGGIGWYKASIKVSSRVGASGEASESFQVWPWRSLSLGIGLLLILMLAFLTMRRSRPRRYSR